MGCTRMTYDAAHQQVDTTTRRTLVKGAAWAMPVVAVTSQSPAMASSPCQVRTNFDSLTPGTSPNPILFPGSAVTATISFNSSGQGGDNTPGDTGTVEATATSPSWNYIEIEMLNPDVGDYIDVTITLSEPVENFSFILHDIDSRSDSYRDTVGMITPAASSATPGSNIELGSGYWGPIAWGDTPISSGEGDLRLAWAGPVSSVTFRYRNSHGNRSQNQHIGLGDLSFTDCPEPGEERAAFRSPVRVGRGFEPVAGSTDNPVGRRVASDAATTTASPNSEAETTESVDAAPATVDL